MKVELLEYTPLWVSDKAIGQCWGKGCFTGDKLQERMNRVANKFKHASTIEHTNYNFHISGISRALLQELARHRMASLSVKSTRYTLKELKDIPYICTDEANEWEIADADICKKYLVQTGDNKVDFMSCLALVNLQDVLKSGVSNDIAKYCLPESYKTELVWTVNARGLQNFIKLRTDKAALWEIRDLAHEIFNQLPNDHKFLFEDSVYDPNKKSTEQLLNEALAEIERLKKLNEN